MSLSHACIGAIVSCVNSHAWMDSDGAKPVMRSTLNGVVKSNEGSVSGTVFGDGQEKWIIQNKTGQMTARHLTSEFGCGGRI